MKQQFLSWIKEAQNNICHQVEKIDAKEKFLEDKWQRPGGGGGITRVIQNGGVFEKAAVNVSEVYGEITPGMKNQLHIEGDQFFATGISLIIHPHNPFVPTVHANYRYFEVYRNGDKNPTECWFGGGADLTPYYLFEEDAKLFHQKLKDSCDKFDPKFYPDFKTECDNYFVNHHRNRERRGVGGIFYDRLKPDNSISSEKLFEFAQSNIEAFNQSYLPIVENRKDHSYSEQNRNWQLIRRGRYVEFNLLHDKGTLFGIKSNGRTESILVSLPLTARFEYNYQPEAGSEEEKLLKVLMLPVKWI